MGVQIQQGERKIIIIIIIIIIKHWQFSLMHVGPLYHVGRFNLER